AVARALAGLGVGQAVAGADERADLVAIGGIGDVVERGERNADELARLGVAVHARHRVVALGDAGAAVQAVDLLVLGQRDGDGGLDLEARHALRALRDERAIALFGAAAVG